MVLVPTLGFALLGAILASFVGVIVARLHTGSPIASGRSQCDSCGKTLSFLDLIPILSFALALGRARCCSSRLGALSPLSEVLLALLFAASYLKFGLSPDLLFFLIALTLLLALVLYDLAHTILPPVLLYPFVLSALVFSWFSSPDLSVFIENASIALALAVSLAVIHFASRGRAMVLADAPFAFGCALLAVGAALSGFIFSFWIGAAIGIIILVKTPRGHRMGIEVPMAPFFALGFLLASFTSWNPFNLVAVLFGAL